MGEEQLEREPEESAAMPHGTRAHTIARAHEQLQRGRRTRPILPADSARRQARRFLLTYDPAMAKPEAFTSEAWNPVPDSENRIHSDEVARRYGFRGGLVPGVTVSAYLLHPAAVAWGRAWLERGRAHVVVHSPVYDGARFRVELEDVRSDAYDAVLLDEDDTRCATAQVSLPASAPAPPQRRGDPLLGRDTSRPDGSPEVMEGLRASGLGAMPARWCDASPMTAYLREPGAMAPVFREAGLANPSFVLGLTNWVLAGNVHMSPWLHLETDSQFHRVIACDTDLVVEASIAGLFEKKGHGFVDLDVGVFDAVDDAAVASIRLRAIYRMRSA